MKNILNSLVLSLASLFMCQSLSQAWSVLTSVDDIAGYNNVYYFKGKYILLAGQGPSYWSSDDGVNFTANPNQYYAQGYEAYILEDLMLIASYSTIQYTTDGVNLVTVYETGIDSAIRGIVKIDDTYIAATEKGIYTTTDPKGSNTWTPAAGNASLPEPQNGTDKNISHIIALDGKLVAAVAFRAPHVSTDKGASFTPMTAGLPANTNEQSVHSMVYDGNYIWAVIGNRGHLYRTNLSNNTWEAVNIQTNTDLIAADPKGGIYRYGSTIQSGKQTTQLQKSVDGVNWNDLFDYNANNTGTSNRWLTFAGDKAYLGGTAKRVFYTLADDLLAPGEFIFRSAYDLGDGWWYSFQWGFFWAGAYPWIYNFYLDWTYIFGPNESGYYAWQPTFGWFFSGRTFFPYIYVFNNSEGYTIDTTTQYPNTLFEKNSGGGKVGINEVGVLSVNFADLSGKTITFSDSIGSHTLVVNSFGNESDRGDLTMSINGQSYLFNFVQLTYTVQLGVPKILLQAQSATGNTVQVGLSYTSTAGGTTSYLGYSLGIVPPVTGGNGVQGTFNIQ